MTTIKMFESNEGEVMHLFELMKKYGVTCSLEMQVEGSANPILGITDAPVSVEYFEGEGGGDALIVNLGEAGFTFEVGIHSYSKHVSDVQISIAVVSENYAVWFNSGAIPPEGIEEANNYNDNEESYHVIHIGEAPEKLKNSVGELWNYIYLGYGIADIYADEDGTIGYTAIEPRELGKR